jgi:hypothetical protein
MPFELQYTSAPRALLPGQSGLATVKMTKGMPLLLREALESLSSYHHGVENTSGNGQAACSSLLHFNAGGNRWYVLSRSANAGLDYTRRHNFFVHHVAFADDEIEGLDPIFLINSSSLLQSKWDGRVEELLTPPQVRSGVAAAPRAPNSLSEEWRNAIVNEALSGKSIYLVTPSESALGLAGSLLAEVPVSDRWELSFITNFQSLPFSVRCGLRCISPTNPAVHSLGRSGALVVDLTKPLGDAPATTRPSTGHALPPPRTVVPKEFPKSPPISKAIPRPTAAPVQARQLIRKKWESRVDDDDYDDVDDDFEDESRSDRSFGSGIAVGAIAGIVLAIVLGIPVVMYLQSGSTRLNDEKTNVENELAKSNEKLRNLNEKYNTQTGELTKTSESLRDLNERYNTQTKDFHVLQGRYDALDIGNQNERKQVQSLKNVGVEWLVQFSDLFAAYQIQGERYANQQKDMQKLKQQVQSEQAKNFSTSNIPSSASSNEKTDRQPGGESPSSSKPENSAPKSEANSTSPKEKSDSVAENDSIAAKQLSAGTTSSSSGPPKTPDQVFSIPDPSQDLKASFNIPSFPLKAIVRLDMRGVTEPLRAKPIELGKAVKCYFLEPVNGGLNKIEAEVCSFRFDKKDKPVVIFNWKQEAARDPVRKNALLGLDGALLIINFDNDDPRTIKLSCPK